MDAARGTAAAPAADDMARRAAEHGMKPGEYDRLVALLGRAPNLTELGIVSVMWSEHCSYKSSRVWLKTLPTTGARVIMGPGENAGVVDIGPGPNGERLAAVFKMESHNHPSFIEPYQGAATGVGGIMRDVFTMGARPVALLNALRFGAVDHPKTRHLVRGVVAGIGDYGNCVGVPTVGGELNFDAAYNDNILVNAMCVGIADAARIFTSGAEGAGNPVVYVGSKTGRDGIHGATMASAEFDDASAAKRPTVQVGDPFMEKLLIEACLELMAGDTILAIQDMGAAGLTSSSAEMAAKGGSGITLNLDAVPQREAGMSAYEMMLSESQERMLMVLRPGSEPAAEAIFRKWGLDFAVIGETNGSGRIVVRHRGVVEADLPTAMLSDDAPQYRRPHVARPAPAPLAAGAVPERPLGEALAALMASPALASRRWVWQQYDHTVGADTVQRPGGDAAVVRIQGTARGLAMSCDVTPRYCAADPQTGGAQAVAECWRNLTAVGAVPIAITNCLNFGNPERPEIMGEFALCLAGMAEACRALDFPVVSGNVSLYNETNGTGIPPTPAIGGVGLLDDLRRSVGIALPEKDCALLLVGGWGTHLGQSLYQQWATGGFAGPPPPVDLAREKRHGDFVRDLIADGTALAAHDVSDGGAFVTLAEMFLAAGGGASVHVRDVQGAAEAFGEDQARYVIAVAAADAAAVLARAKAAVIDTAQIGTSAHAGWAGGVRAIAQMAVADAIISHDMLSGLHEATLPTLFGTPTE